MTHQQICKIAICQIFQTFHRHVFVNGNFVQPESGGHNVFKAAKLPTSWLKIPKSVIVTDSPLSSLKYLMYLAKMSCDSKNVFLVGRRSWSRSCHCAVGVVGVIGTISLPYIRHSPCRFPYNLCALRQRHRNKFGNFSCCDDWWLR